MECRIDDAVINYVEHGDGPPLLALHGAGVDHREIEAAIEPLLRGVGYRRIYPDLPGMGNSGAAGLDSNDEVVALFGEFIEQVCGGPVLVLGHSYGAYLARGIASRHPALVRGLALLCPLGEGTHRIPGPSVVAEEPGWRDELDSDRWQGFAEYFVVRTRAMARRYRDSVLPGTRVVDADALERLGANWTVAVEDYSGPALLVAGRRDSTVGYEETLELVEHYPRSSTAIIDGAGHALMHERPEVLGALLEDWLRRSAA